MGVDYRHFQCRESSTRGILARCHCMYRASSMTSSRFVVAREPPPRGLEENRLSSGDGLQEEQQRGAERADGVHAEALMGVPHTRTWKVFPTIGCSVGAMRPARLTFEATRKKTTTAITTSSATGPSCHPSQAHHRDDAHQRPRREERERPLRAVARVGDYMPAFATTYVALR